MNFPRWIFRLVKICLLFVILVTLLTVKNSVLPEKGQAQTASPKKTFLPLVGFSPPSPNSPPLASTSYYFYMRYYTQEKARNFGCEIGKRDLSLPGKQDSLLILDFGIPKVDNGIYGASGMMVGGFVNLNQIADAVQQFGTGYWICVGSDYTSHLRIGIGTNNYNNDGMYPVNFDHGKAWAGMVNRVANYFVNICPRGCDGQVDVVGANDIELAWSSPQDAYNWVTGYASTSLYPLINFGAAEGCPNACGGGGYYWTREQVWRVANAWPVYPLPEIYRNDGRNAEQWYQLSLYSAQQHGYPFQFLGTMTTYGACQQVKDDLCSILDNTPQQGWQQLYDRINGRVRSTWHSLPYSTDIRWSE